MKDYVIIENGDSEKYNLIEVPKVFIESEIDNDIKQKLIIAILNAGELESLKLPENVCYNETDFQYDGKPDNISIQQYICNNIGEWYIQYINKESLVIKYLIIEKLIYERPLE
jgi:hypothetical protein